MLNRTSVVHSSTHGLRTRKVSKTRPLQAEIVALASVNVALPLVWSARFASTAVLWSGALMRFSRVRRRIFRLASSSKPDRANRRIHGNVWTMTTCRASFKEAVQGWIAVLKQARKLWYRRTLNNKNVKRFCNISFYSLNRNWKVLKSTWPTYVWGLSVAFDVRALLRVTTPWPAWLWVAAYLEDLCGDAVASSSPLWVELLVKEEAE